MANSSNTETKSSWFKEFMERIWVSKLMLPILIPLVNTVIIAFFIADLNKPKTGELHIFSDQDSTEVILDGESKGITGPDEKYSNMFVLKINSIYPGTYPVMLKKRSFVPFVISDVVVNPGYLTSKSVRLEPLSVINSLNRPDTVKHIKTESIKIDSGRKLPVTKRDELVTVEPSIINSIDKVKTSKLSIWLTEEIPLSNVNLFVNSSFLGSPSSYQIQIEVPVGNNEIIFTYSDAIGIKHTYSITRNISGHDTLFVEKNEFKPKIRN
jgi:hypothetical protein